VAERADGGRDADDAMLRAGYERLRAAVLSSGPDAWRLGHGVLAARGIVGWMAAFGALGPAAAADHARERSGAGSAGPPSSASSGAPGAEVVALPGAEEVVAVLAQMTLALAA
jgi:hypothetical protein